jgi:hypothetical protein
VAFRKSSRSNGSGGNQCVEVDLDAETGAVLVRDSKDPITGCRLRFTDAEWDAFIAGVKAGEFDLPPERVPSGGSDPTPTEVTS